jgi:hypothetical protein
MLPSYLITNVIILVELHALTTSMISAPDARSCTGLPRMSVHRRSNRAAGSPRRPRHRGLSKQIAGARRACRDSGAAHMTRVCATSAMLDCAGAGAEAIVRALSGLRSRQWRPAPCPISSLGQSAGARPRPTIRPAPPRSPWPRGSFGTPRRNGHRRRRRDRAGAPSRSRRWSRW